MCRKLHTMCFIFYICLFFLCHQTALAQSPWENIEPGLELASFAVQNDEKIRIAVLRINPNFFEFPLLSISENNGNPQTLLRWIDNHGLVAGINASMYLPDGKTSTGYMRSGEHINNKHIAKSFGAFFLAKPRYEGLPSAKLIDRDTENWKELLEQYDIVVQNYRLINSARKVLWSAGGRKHSIAAVAEDANGNILFLHCRNPIAAHEFATALLDLPIDIRTAMYVEGGVQAGLALRSAKEDLLIGGLHPSDIFSGSVSVALPNVLGVKRKNNKVK